MVTKTSLFIGLLLWGIIGGIIGASIVPNVPELIFCFTLAGSAGHFLAVRERVLHA